VLSSPERPPVLHGRGRSVGGTIGIMPLELTDAELVTAATACRAMAYQESERAKKMENPGMRGPIERTAQRFAALAVKFEAVRRRSNTGKA
jgi:hypothetical protein